MPLTITIPEREFYDEKTGRFITTKKTTVIMEHSLLSISKWESKWHKPYLTKEKKTELDLTSNSAISFIDDDCYAASAAVADKSSILFVIIDAAFLTSSSTVRMNFASSFRFWSHDFR